MVLTGEILAIKLKISKKDDNRDIIEGDGD